VRRKYEFQFIALDDDGRPIFQLDSLGNQIPLDTLEMKRDTIIYKPDISVERIENDTIPLDVPNGTTPSIIVIKKKKE